MVAKFTTDIPKPDRVGRAVSAGGQESIHVAHTPDERIAKQELLEAVETYVQLARDLVR